MYQSYKFISTSMIFSEVAFRIYDVDDDGVISRDELMTVLRLMVGDNLTQDELDEITSRTISAVNFESDTIKWEDFYSAMSCIDVRRLMSLKPQCQH